MITRQKLLTTGIPTLATATIVTAALLAGRSTEPAWDKPVDPPVEPVAQQGHEVDVVFAMDTTISMSGMIEGAKQTVWSIATHIKQVDPSADVHMGLVAYRDIGDDYVTKDFPLSGDLDAMFANLSSLRADGGNDIPEDVDAGLYDAVHKMPWRPGAKKMIFVVGDAEPATRGDVPAYTVTAANAANMGITVNAIRVGGSDLAKVAFARMAAVGGGDFSSTQENGNVQLAVTPYDAKMAELSRKIDSTAIIVGDDAARGAYAEKLSAGSAAAAPAMADRAAFYATKGAAPRDKADVIGGEGGTGALDGVAPGALPTELRALSKDELRAEVARRTAERESAQAEIAKLQAQRTDYLKTHAPAGPADAFDAEVNQAVEKAMKK